MAIFNLFSKRQKQLRGEVPDVYIYDEILQPLRVQIIHILRESLGNKREYNQGKYLEVYGTYKFIVGTLCREYGVFRLVDQYGERNYMEELHAFFLQEQDSERVLDVIELSFRGIDKLTREWNYRNIHNGSEMADNSIAELNARFKEHGIGYQFENGEIIRVDSQFLHTEVVKPALKLLSGKVYKAANDEFLQAHEHYRHRRYKDSLTWALKSLESTMKAICDKRNWAYNQNDTAKRLIKICLDNGLIPSFWQSHFSALRATLENGVPAARNIMGGHGNGTSPITVPQHLATYCLHLTASTLVFLIEAEKSLA